MGKMAILALALTVAACGAGGGAGSGGISKAEFDSLHSGMTRDEAADVVGSAGEVISESELAGVHTVMVQWQGETGLGANANAMFQDGKLIQKAQAGLQ